MGCDRIETPTGAVIVCSRGSGRRPACAFPAVPAGTEKAPTCRTCGKPVDTYETADGRTLAYQHR